MTTSTAKAKIQPKMGELYSNDDIVVLCTGTRDTTFNAVIIHVWGQEKAKWTIGQHISFFIEGEGFSPFGGEVILKP